MRRSRRMWAKVHPRPTSPVAAVSPPNRLDNTRGELAAQRQNRDELTPDELGEQSGEELPERQAMSLIDANPAATVNAAAALNVVSDDSTAVANADQSAEIQQSP
jgi:hypothetical protein